MSREASDREPLAALATLEDPLRRRLYEYVAAQDAPVSREQAAGAIGIGRTLAAYHLDKLTGAGLLTYLYRRPPGRDGPGAGRPAKLYRRADREFSVSVPPRDYQLLARLLAEAASDEDAGPLRAAVQRGAGVAGQAAGRANDDLLTALIKSGYQPDRAADDTIELRNCPFHRLAQDHPELVCGLNLHLVEGIIAGSAATGTCAELEPRPDRCCVVIHNAPPARGRRFSKRRRRRSDQ